MKAMIDLALPFIKKYPGFFYLTMLTFAVGFGYMTIKAEVDKKASKEVVQEISNDIGDIKNEFKYMAKYFTGDSSFKNEIKTLPPQEYLIGIDTEILRHKFDSCKPGVIDNPETEKPNWYCFYTDSAGSTVHIVFKNGGS